MTGHVTFVLEVFCAAGISAQVLGWLQLRHGDVVFGLAKAHRWEW